MSARPLPAQQSAASAARVVVACPNGLRRRRLVTALAGVLGDGVEEAAQLEELRTDPGAAAVAVVPYSALDDKPLSSPVAHVRVLAVVEDLEAARKALVAGADSVVIDDGRAEALAAAVQAVAFGHSVVPGVLRRRLGRTALTVREKQTLALVVMGFSNREIAAQLHVAETTVKSHLSSAFRKLGVRSRNDACALILDAETGLGPGILTI